MDYVKKFSKILRKIEIDFPYPVAFLARKIDSTTNKGEKLSLIIELFEIHIRLLSAFLLISYRNNKNEIKNVENFLQKSEKGGKFRFSLGFWNGLLEIIPCTGLGEIGVEIAKMKRSLCEKEINLYNMALVETLKPSRVSESIENDVSVFEKNLGIQKNKTSISSKTGWNDICKTMTQLRNRYKGHGSFLKLTNNQAEVFIEPVAVLMGYILEKSLFFSEFPMVSLNAYFGEKNRKHDYRLSELTGISEMFRKKDIQLKEKLELGLYFSSRSEEKDSFYPLHPIVILGNCSCNRDGGTIKFLDGINKKKLYYICGKCDERIELLDEKNRIAEVFKKKQPAILGMNEDYKDYKIIISESIIFGRSSDCEFRIAKKYSGVSRTHFKLSFAGSKIKLMDLCSSNGTKINDKKIKPSTNVILKENDIISIDILKFKFIYIA